PMTSLRTYHTATLLSSGLVLAAGPTTSAELFGAAVGGTCAGDSDCVQSGSYCASSGTCQAQKAQGGTCDETADCKVAGCAECAPGFCVTGFCCNSACSSWCRVCAVIYGATANGTCPPAPAGSNNPLCQAPAACNGVSQSCP